jgi:hypothetical protein
LFPSLLQMSTFSVNQLRKSRLRQFQNPRHLLILQVCNICSFLT